VHALDGTRYDSADSLADFRSSSICCCSVIGVANERQLLQLAYSQDQPAAA
jgi:hypothetical protein